MHQHELFAHTNTYMYPRFSESSLGFWDSPCRMSCGHCLDHVSVPISNLFDLRCNFVSNGGRCWVIAEIQDPLSSSFVLIFCYRITQPAYKVRFRPPWRFKLVSFFFRLLVFAGKGLEIFVPKIWESLCVQCAQSCVHIMMRSSNVLRYSSRSEGLAAM